MNEQIARRLLNLRNSEHFPALVEYFDMLIKRAHDELEGARDEIRFRQVQGMTAAFRGVLKDFEQLELLVQAQDNPSADPV